MDLFSKTCISIIIILGISMIIKSFANSKILLETDPDRMVVKKDEYIKVNKMYYRINGIIFIIIGIINAFTPNQPYAIAIGCVLLIIVNQITRKKTKPYVKDKH